MVNNNDIHCTYILDIELELLYLENILSKYIDYPSGVYYTDGMRYPISNTGKLRMYNKLSKLYNKPTNPLLVIPLVEDIIYNISHDHIEYRELLRSNPLTNGSNNDLIYGINNTISYVDIILRLVPNISKADYDSMCTYCSTIESKITNIITTHKNNIVKVDMFTHEVILEIHESILEYRYNQMLNHKGDNLCVAVD